MIPRLIHYGIVLCALMLLPCSQTFAWQDPAIVTRVVRQFIQQQLRGQTPPPEIDITPLDAQNQLPSCRQLSAYIPNQQPLWGKVTVGVRCRDAGNWSAYVSAHIHVYGPYLVSARPLGINQSLSPSDFRLEHGDLTELPGGFVHDFDKVIGRTLRYGMGANQVLRADMLNQPLVIQAGQSVRLVYRGAGFDVSNEGRAMTNATEGQLVQVRMASGQPISGIARQGGVVEINGR